MLTKLTLSFFVIIVLFSIFMSSFFHLMNTELDLNNKFIVNETLINNDQEKIDDKFENFFWFVHLSDTHLSYFQDKDRKSDLIDLCRNVIPIIKPTVLLLTGDITDARTGFPLGSDQYKQEWLMYQNVHEECMKANPYLKWLDIKGNHDSFNTYNDFNNFNNFTVQSNMSKDGKSYRYELQTKDGNRYSFIGVDACLKPGVKRPFNFVGQFDQEEINKLIKFKEQSANTNYTIWYGHYPTSAIFNKDSLRKLINGPYLCGHYHTVHGLVPSMISTQPQGFLEAETGDWKDYRVFRIAAIDHGLFTFANYNYQRHKELPLILITNPRSILHQMENIEPFWRTSRSSHIRTLIFSQKPIVEARAFISKQPKFSRDDFLEEFELKHKRDVLWTCEWSTEKYSNGLYYLTVIASDEHYSNQITIPFSLDRTKPAFSFWARLILRFQFRTIGIFAFSWGFFFSTIPLILLRTLISNDAYYTRHMFNLSRRRYVRKIVFKLYLLSHQDKIFFPIVFLPIYSLFGPWFIAYLVSDYIGIVFAWGQFVHGTFLPVGFTFIFAAIFLLIFHLPFISCLSSLIHGRYVEITNAQKDDSEEKPSDSKSKSISQKFFNEVTFNTVSLVLITVFQGVAASLFYFAYGFLAFITNFYLWICLIYLIMIRSALNLDGTDFRIGSYQPCSQINANQN